MNLITRQELSPSLRAELDDVKNYIAGSNNAEMGAHMLSTENPHSVTKAQVGLGNVLDIKQATEVDFLAHQNNTANPHNVTTAQIGAVPTSRQIVAGVGMIGGGTLNGDIYLGVDENRLDVKYLLRQDMAVDSDKLDGYHHTDFHKVNSRFLHFGEGRSIFYGNDSNDLYFRQSGFNDNRFYHTGNIRKGTGAPSGGRSGDIYIQY